MLLEGHSLSEIEGAEQLREWLVGELPYSFRVFGFVVLQDLFSLRENKEEWPFEVKWYVKRSGQLGEGGETEAILMVANNSVTMYITSRKDTQQRLEIAENVLKQFDWTIPQSFGGLEKLFLPLIQKMTAPTCNIAFLESSTVYMCPRKNFKTPEESLLPKITSKAKLSLSINEITFGDAETINRHWTYSSPASLIYLRKCLQIAPSCCIRKADVTSNQPNETNLVGWVGSYYDMTYGFLHVLESYRKMGIALLLVSELTKKLMDLLETWVKHFCVNENINNKLEDLFCGYTFISKENIPSQTLFQRIGFSTLVEIFWISLVPKPSTS